MKTISKFIRSTLRGGLLVLFPLFACTYIFVHIAGLSIEFIKPLVSFIPNTSLVGLALADLVSTIILLVLCCLTGLAMRTSAGKSFGLRLSRRLDRVPGYEMFARLARVIFDPEDPSGIPVIVRLGDTKQIGFLIEHHGPDEVTVFFPSAPSPLSGNVLIVRADMVERLHVPAAKVARVMATFGAGSSELLKTR